MLAAVHIEQAEKEYSVEKLDIEIRQSNRNQFNHVSDLIQTIWELWILSRQLRDKMVLSLEALFECMKVSENILTGQAHMGEGSWMTGKSEAGRKSRMRRSELGRIIAWDMDILSNA